MPKKQSRWASFRKWTRDVLDTVLPWRRESRKNRQLQEDLRTAQREAEQMKSYLKKAGLDPSSFEEDMATREKNRARNRALRLKKKNLIERRQKELDEFGWDYGKMIGEVLDPLGPGEDWRLRKVDMRRKHYKDIADDPDFFFRKRREVVDEMVREVERWWEGMGEKMNKNQMEAIKEFRQMFDEGRIDDILRRQGKWAFHQDIERNRVVLFGIELPFSPM